MRKQAKSLKQKQKFYTQNAQTFYPQHLMLKRKKLFANYPQNPQLTQSMQKKQFYEQTNFGFAITNEFVFVLLHLRAKDQKNILNLNIPQICIFVDKMPYDIVRSEGGVIKSFRQQDGVKCRLRDMQLEFKQVWKAKKMPKFQNITAVFKGTFRGKLEKQVLILSQTDFIIACKKIKSDPFFKKLQYIQNKLSFVGQQIVSQYDSSIKQDQILKLATQGLFGYQSQELMLRQLGQQRYLSFLNQKISLVLNYQHNIRMIRANFHYVKNEEGIYYLVNVTNLHFANLTRALKERESKLKRIQQERDKLLYLSPQKQRKYKSYQKPQQVKKYQSLMKDNFQTIVKKMNFLSISQSKNQQIKNQLAFRRLHPQLKDQYKELLGGRDFKRTKEKLFGNTISGRKPISIPSKYVLRSYNKVKRSVTMMSQSQGEE